jgi:dihydroxy-acid dehydratase
MRLAAWKPAAPHYTRGYGKMFLDHILQADEGCDFDFLRGRSESSQIMAGKFRNPAM